MSLPHILFVAPSAYSLGGLATWLDYLLPGLELHGWRVTLGLVAGPRYHRTPAYLTAHPWHDTLEVYCRTGTERGRRNAVQRAVLGSRPDIVCSVNVPDALAAVAELRAEGTSRARSVMTCHGIQSDLFGDMIRLEPSLDAVICTNRLACALAKRRLAGTVADVKYAPYGTEIAGVETRQPVGSPLAIAYVGRFEEEQKRVSDVVRIIRGLADAGEPFRLMVAGGGLEEQAFRSSLEVCLPDGCLEWVGQVPAAQLSHRVYRRADVLLLTSQWETGPIVAWEAMAHGMAVVSTRYIGSGLEGAMRHRENALLFDIGDWDAGVDAIRELSEDRHLWSRLSQEGRRMVENRYTIGQSVSSWDAVLRSVCTSSPRELLPPELRPAHGRLTSKVGPKWGERFRTLWPMLPPDSGPGGEWPHTLSGGSDDEAFWRDAARMDRAETDRDMAAPKGGVTAR